MPIRSIRFSSAIFTNVIPQNVLTPANNQKLRSLLIFDFFWQAEHLSRVHIVYVNNRKGLTFEWQYGHLIGCIRFFPFVSQPENTALSRCRNPRPSILANSVSWFFWVRACNFWAWPSDRYKIDNWIMIECYSDLVKVLYLLCLTTLSGQSQQSEILPTIYSPSLLPATQQHTWLSACYLATFGVATPSSSEKPYLWLIDSAWFLCVI